MDIDKYCEDGILFDVIYNINNGTQDQVVRKFLFTIDDTEETVKATLTAPPYNMDIAEVIESSYILNLKNSNDSL